MAEALLAYLFEAPDAMDTVDGVTEWRLMRQRVRDEVEAVTRVLDTLVASGVLEVLEVDSRRCYRLARTQRH